MFDREWMIGDTVYTGDAFGHKIETVVRTTHAGERFVTDGGTRILKDGKYEVGSGFRTIWHLYTPETQKEWDAEIVKRKVKMRLSKLDIPVHRDPWRSMDTRVLFEIADFIEQRLPRKENRDEHA